MKSLNILDKKPKIEASRLGKKRSDSATRPVKVSLPSPFIVQQILSKSKNLRDNDKFRTVFWSPDRTLAQRTQHKELVDQLKIKKTQESQKRHFIKGGKVCSVVISSNWFVNSVRILKVLCVPDSLLLDQLHLANSCDIIYFNFIHKTLLFSGNWSENRTRIHIRRQICRVSILFIYFHIHFHSSHHF